MKTLLHICCAPCANQPIEVLRTDVKTITLDFTPEEEK